MIERLSTTTTEPFAKVAVVSRVEMFLESILARQARGGTSTSRARARGVVGGRSSGALALIRILAEGQLLLELATELPVQGHELLAGRDESLARGDHTISLNPDEDLRDVGVADWMGWSVPVKKREEGDGEEMRNTYSCKRRT
jgi:hypothetical protein